MLQPPQRERAAERRLQRAAAVQVSASWVPRRRRTAPAPPAAASLAAARSWWAFSGSAPPQEASVAQEALVALEAAAQAVALEPEPAPRCGMPAARYFEGLPGLCEIRMHAAVSERRFD